MSSERVCSSTKSPEASENLSETLAWTMVPEGAKLGEFRDRVAVEVPPPAGRMGGFRLPLPATAGSSACTGTPVNAAPNAGMGTGGVVTSGITNAYAPAAGTLKLTAPFTDCRLVATMIQACKPGL